MVTDRHGAVLAVAGDVDRRGLKRWARGAEIRGALAGQRNGGLLAAVERACSRSWRCRLRWDWNVRSCWARSTLGFRLDDKLAERFKRVTESDIAFAADGQIKASTLPPDDRQPLLSLLTASGVQTISLDDKRVRGTQSSVGTCAAAQACETGAPAVLILRSRTERLRFPERDPHRPRRLPPWWPCCWPPFSATPSRAPSRDPWRPSATSCGRCPPPATSRGRFRCAAPRSWEDEDAKLLATTFNTLTDSIARFQREAAQRERLSSLGRLSTVVAHEIRNPLMIIKASLRTLGSDHVSRAEMRQALTDVRRGSGAAEPGGERRAGLRAADPIRLCAGGCQCRLCRRRTGHAGSGAADCACG